MLWGLFIVVIAGLAIARPHRPITNIYHAAATAWWSGQPVYTEGIHGFLYLPSAAVLFGPFTLLPVPVADHLWRLLSLALLTWGVARVAGLFAPERRWSWAQWILAMGIPTLAVNVLRTQWELTMLALLLHAAVDVAGERWRRAGLLLALSVGLKPLALVPALLFAAARPRLIVWMAVGGAVVLALPFVHGDPGYVAGQYAAMVAKLTSAAQPDSGRWFEIGMLLRALGLHPDVDTLFMVRAVAAVATLVLALGVARRRDAAVLVLLLGLLYLDLFNPRTEEGSYAGPALLAAALLMRERAVGHRVAMWALGAVVFAFGTHFYGDWIYRPTETWIKQITALALYGFIAWSALQSVAFKSQKSANSAAA